jgi:hypothetical protein
MCFKNLFKKKPVPPTEEPIPEEPPLEDQPITPLVLPYPEEPQDTTRTINNTFAGDLIRKWFSDYNVPIIHQHYWVADINIEISLRYSSPGATGGGHIYIRPDWANSGVLAHEACHIVWGDLLSVDERMNFESLFNLNLITSDLLKLAWETKPYMRTNIVESHADCYRYLGRYMPDNLKPYYPNLVLKG